jgi:hypothetical protein
MKALNVLNSVVRGRVWLPGDPDFDVARRAWNLAVDQPVAAVVDAADADDVAALVRHARSAGLGIATQPNGHGASGRTEGAILMRTRRLDALEIDPVDLRPGRRRRAVGPRPGRDRAVRPDRSACRSPDWGPLPPSRPDPSPGLSRTELLTTLDDSALGTLLENPIAPLLSVQIRHLGGALARPSDSPHGPVTEPYALYLFGVPTDPARAEAITAKQRALAGALPASGRKPFTFLNPDETVADAFSPEALARLLRIKREHDQGNVFRANFPIQG